MFANFAARARSVGAILLWLLAAAPLAAQPVAVDLILCLDTSGSMSTSVGTGVSRWDIERDGAASAVADPTVIPQDGSVRVTVIQFSGSAKLEVPPTPITAATAPSVATKIQAIQPFFGSTDISSCLDLAVTQLAAVSSVAAKEVIDVSTDGIPNTPPGQGPQAAVASADAAIQAGVDAVNALGIVLGSQGSTFLGSMVRPQPNGGPDGFVVSVDDIAEYRAKLSEKIVREISQCLSIGEDDVEILCPGDGGDIFTVTLTFQNQGTGEVHDLFVLEDPGHPPPAGVVVLDDYFNFASDPICSPVSDPSCTVADASRTVSVRVRGKPGDTFDLLLTAHNADHSDCCARTVPIELPACDCAQVTHDAVVCQPTLAGPRWTYDFTLQNLTDRAVEHVLLTPISPQGIDFDPNHFLNLGLAPVSPAGGGTASASVHISGADAAAGREVCFHLSLHTFEFDECCAIERCVKLPSCRIGDPVTFDPIGASTVFFRDSTLVVSNLGRSGRDGLSFSTPAAESFRAIWEPLELARPDAFVQVTGRGTVGGRTGRPVVAVRAMRTDAGTRVQPRTFVGALRTVEVRRGGETVASIPIHDGQGVTVLGAGPFGEVQLARLETELVVIWPEPVALLPDGAGGEPIEGDELAFTTALRAEVGGLTEVVVRARSLPEIAFTRVDATVVEEP